jgi:integrase
MKTRELRKSPTWWIAYSYRGIKHRESSNSTRRQEAVKLLRRRLEEMGRGQLQGPTMERTTFEDLARLIEQEYQINGRRSADRMKMALAALREVFGYTLACDMTLDRLTAYMAQRLNEKIAPASVRYELAILRRAFRLAQRAGKAICPPFPSIQVHNTRTGFFEQDHFLAVRKHLPAYLQPVVTFAYLTGWRVPSEILSLQWRQVDVAAGTVRLEPGTTKNDEGRVFPFAVLPELPGAARTPARTDPESRAGQGLHHSLGLPSAGTPDSELLQGLEKRLYGCQRPGADPA